MPTEGFAADDETGHGTHVAGTVAGAIESSSSTLVDCDGEEMGCAGKCLGSDTSDDDDIWSPPIDRLCPLFDCEGATKDSQCLSDDVAKTLVDHGGMAQGAKLAVMDIFFENWSYGDLIGSGLYEASAPTGARIHSNSWGVDSRCEVDLLNIAYDEFMYEVGVRTKFIIYWKTFDLCT